jgi:hypothetical protein
LSILHNRLSQRIPTIDKIKSTFVKVIREPLDFLFPLEHADLPLDEKIVERKQRMVQVYIVTYGLLLSNFHLVSSINENVLNGFIVLFFGSALVYYSCVSRCNTEFRRKILRIGSVVVSVSLSFMLLMYVNVSLFWQLFLIIFFSLLIDASLVV